MVRTPFCTARRTFVGAQLGIYTVKTNDKNFSAGSSQVSSEKYSEWIEMVAHFTTESLKQWRWAGGSVCYLLALWSRLVTSVPYFKGETPALLDTKVPDIVSTYIQSR